MTTFNRGRTSRRVPRHALLAACGLGLIVQPGLASAQDSDAARSETIRSSDGGLDEIIVTAPHFVPTGAISANKTDIPLIETPQSVSVITRDQIDLLHFVDVQQAVRYTAGVFGENYGPDQRYDFITVRGFTPKQYIDGLAAPISTTIYSVGVDLYAFDAVDILKGPSSVLYGNAPPGGLYNLTSRRASSTFGGEVTAQYGYEEYRPDDYKEIAATVTGPVNGSLNARMTFLYRDRDGKIDDVRSHRVFLAPTATWNIGSGTSLTGLFYFQRDKVQGDTFSFLPVYGTLLPNPNGRIPRGTNLGEPSLNIIRRHQMAAGYEFSHEFSPALTFKSNVKWNRYNEGGPEDAVYGGAGLINTTDPEDPSYFRTVGRYNFTYFEKVRSFAMDNRLSGKFETGTVRHKVLLGVDMRNVFNYALFGFGGATEIDLYNPVYGAPQDTPPLGVSFGFPVAPFNNQRLKQTGAYAQDQVNFGDLFITLGGRYDWVRVRNYNSDTTTKQGKFTYRVGANYVTASGFSPYVSYATSFEPVLGTDANTDKEFKPSTGRQIEGGIKYDARGLPDDVKLFATASIFKINQKNVVSTAPSVTPVSGTQSGEVEVYGGELELVGRFHDQLSINASYSYNHSEVIKSAIAVEVGAPLPTTPKHKLSMFVDYTLKRGSLGGLGFGAGGRYTSSSAGSLPGPFNATVYDAPGVTLFDATVHYDIPGWRFAINGSNVFDKLYVARCASASGCGYGAGRLILGSVTRRF